LVLSLVGTSTCIKVKHVSIKKILLVPVVLNPDKGAVLATPKECKHHKLRTTVYPVAGSISFVMMSTY